MSTVEELTEQLQDLSLLVKKQSEMLAKTGEQVLLLQIQNQKMRVCDFGSSLGKIGGKARLAKSIDTTEFATNDDLVQLVGELQGQLDILEERSIRRLINSQKKDGETLAPILNHNGEEPDLAIYPKDIAALEELDDASLVKLAKFYELLAPTEGERKKFDELVESEDARLDTFEYEVKPEDYSKEELIDAFDDLSRFLGLAARRGTDAW